MPRTQSFIVYFTQPETPPEEDFSREFIVYAPHEDLLEEFRQNPFSFEEFELLLNRMWSPFPEKEITIVPLSESMEATGGPIDLYLGALFVTANYKMLGNSQ
jgi:hypothetical protein